MHTHLRVAVVAALIAALGLIVAVPAGATQDPPTYVRSSQPDGYELFGRHTKQTGATTRCSLGFQRRPSDGWYRWWGKCSGDGRPIVAIFSQTVMVASPDTWGPTTVATPSGPTVYKVGQWHPLTDAALAITKVNVSYVTGRSTGYRCLDTYIIRKGQRKPWGNPREGC